MDSIYMKTNVLIHVLLVIMPQLQENVKDVVEIVKPVMDLLIMNVLAVEIINISIRINVITHVQMVLINKNHQNPVKFVIQDVNYVMEQLATNVKNVILLTFLMVHLVKVVLNANHNKECSVTLLLQNVNLVILHVKNVQVNLITVPNVLNQEL